MRICVFPEMGINCSDSIYETYESIADIIIILKIYYLTLFIISCYHLVIAFYRYKEYDKFSRMFIFACSHDIFGNLWILLLLRNSLLLSKNQDILLFMYYSLTVCFQGIADLSLKTLMFKLSLPFKYVMFQEYIDMIIYESILLYTMNFVIYCFILSNRIKTPLEYFQAFIIASIPASIYGIYIGMNIHYNIYIKIDKNNKSEDFLKDKARFITSWKLLILFGGFLLIGFPILFIIPFTNVGTPLYNIIFVMILSSFEALMNCKTIKKILIADSSSS